MKYSKEELFNYEINKVDFQILTSVFEKIILF